MKLYTRLLSVFTILVILLTAYGCSPSVQEKIIGNWEIRNESADVAIIFSFKDDGILRIWLNDVPVDGTYTWLDDITIQITMTMADKSQDISGEVKINGDQLTITNQKGEIETLTRVE